MRRDKSINNIVLRIGSKYYLLTPFDYKMWLNATGLQYISPLDSWIHLKEDCYVKYLQKDEFGEYKFTVTMSSWSIINKRKNKN
jgi:hypothetical protein